MQIMIDSANERLSCLMAALGAVVMLARLRADEEGVDQERLEGMMLTAVTRKSGAPRPIQAPTPPPVGTPAPVHTPVIPLPPGNQPVAPVEHPPVHPDATDVPTGTEEQEQPAADLLPPSAIFGGTLPGESAPATPVAVVPPVPSAPIVTGGAAPSAPVAAPAPSSTNVVGLDKDGFPWDARIHSETKKVNADGTWRKRRNLDPATLNAVTIELTAARDAARGGAAGAATFQPPATVPSPVSVPAPAAQVPVPPAPPAAVSVPPVPAAGNVPAPPVTATVVPFPNQAPAATAVPVPPAPGVGVSNAGLPPVVSSFRDLIQLVNLALSKGTMKPEQMNEACAHAKVDSITGLASQPLLIPDVYKYMLSRNWLVPAA